MIPPRQPDPNINPVRIRGLFPDGIISISAPISRFNYWRIKLAWKLHVLLHHRKAKKLRGLRLVMGDGISFPTQPPGIYINGVLNGELRPGEWNHIQHNYWADPDVVAEFHQLIAEYDELKAQYDTLPTPAHGHHWERVNDAKLRIANFVLAHRSFYGLGFLKGDDKPDQNHKHNANPKQSFTVRSDQEVTISWRKVSPHGIELTGIDIKPRTPSK